MSFCSFSAQQDHLCDTTDTRCSSFVVEVEQPLSRCEGPLSDAPEFSAAPCDKKSSDREDVLDSTNLFSEASRETLLGSPRLPRDTLENYTSFGGDDEGHGNNSELEQGTAQLNLENLLLMEKGLVNGNAPLKSEFLSTNTISFKKMPFIERPVSVVTVFPETESDIYDSLKGPPSNSELTFSHGNKAGNSPSLTQLWSVDSVCGSSVAPNVLTHRNLDRLSCQLRFGTSVLRPELLAVDQAMELEWTFGNEANDNMMSLCVECGSELEGDLESQSWSKAKYNEVNNKCRLCGTNSAEHEKHLLPATDEYQKNLLEKAYATSPLEPCKTFENMMSERLSLFSSSESSKEKESGQPLSELSMNYYCDNICVDGGKVAERQKPARFCKTEPDTDHKKKLEMNSILCEIFHLCSKLLNQAANFKVQLQLSERRTKKMYAKMEERLVKMETRIAELGENFYTIQAFENDTFKKTLKEEAMQSSKRSYGEHIDDQILQVDHHQHQENISAKENHGVGKVRLIVTVCFLNIHCEFLLPISVDATVGMCKRELLRRLLQQGLIGDYSSCSNLFLLQDSVALYDDDKLADVLDLSSLNTPVADNFVRLTLSTLPSNTICSLNKTQPCELATTTQHLQRHSALSTIGVCTGLASALTSSDDNNAKGAQLDTVTADGSFELEQKTTSLCPVKADGFLQQKDLGLLSAVNEKEIFQNEFLYRRLVSELERLERDELFKDEKARSTFIVKEAMDVNRFLLLNQAVHSPVETHRAMASDALRQLDTALHLGATLEEMDAACSAAQAVVQRIGEASDVAGDAGAMAALQGRKRQLVEEIKEMGSKIAHQLRVPANMIKRAESLKQEAERAVILASSMTQKELDTLHKALADFCTVVSLK